MICEIICVAGFLCMSNLSIVHISSAYVHVICILSEHMRIMRILSAVVLDIFLPNRQCQCHPYIISSTLYIFYHGEYVICTLPDDVSSAPLPDDVSSTPLPDDMSSALQRNMSYLFEV